MKFPNAQALNPLDLSNGRRASARALTPADLDPASRHVKAGLPQTQHDQLVKQTQKWVAQTFFGTLLKQMEDSPFKSEMFSGGRGGQAFSSLYHQQLAERMAGAAGSKLVNSVVRRIEAKQAKEGSGVGVQGSEKKQDPGLDLRHRNVRGPYKRARGSGMLDLFS